MTIQVLHQQKEPTVSLTYFKTLKIYISDMSSLMLFVLVVVFLVPLANSYCSFGLEQCGVEHNASTTYFVAANTTVKFTGCKCDNTELDSGGPVESTCLKNSTWSHDLPSCTPNNTCVRPSTNVNISCLNENDSSWSYCEQTDFCVGEKIGWSCPGYDGDLSIAACQCDGKWSAEVCPPLMLACNATELERCGSNINFSSGISYNGTVPVSSTATFQSSCNGNFVMSLCNSSGFWVTQGLDMCLLPEVNGVDIWCFISVGNWRKCKDIMKTEFCQGERIGWFCPNSEKWKSTTCQCDGYWKEEVCPKPVCSVTDLHRCADNITYSSDPNYYGTVNTCTTAVFDSDNCGPSVAVTTVCQPGGQWLTEGIITCSLPDVGDLDVLFCRNETDSGWKNCEKLRKKSFCSNERIGSFCNTSVWRTATCMCDGTWDEDICMTETSSMASAILTSTTSNLCLVSQSSSYAPVFTNSPSSSIAEPAKTTSLILSISVVAGVVLLLVVALLLLVLNFLWCHYNKRRRRDYFSGPVSKFVGTKDKQEEEMVSNSTQMQLQEGFRNRTFTQSNSYSKLHKDGEPVLILVDEDPSVVQCQFKSDSVQAKTELITIDQHNETDMSLRQDDLDALSISTDSPYEEPPLTEQGVINLLEKYKAYSISETALTLLDQIGSGEFGEVYKGKLEKNKGHLLEVAVKTVKQGPKEEQGKKALLQEAALLAQFKHPNIITMYGVCRGERLMVATELMHSGDLRSHLLSIRKVSDPDSSENLPQLLLSFCRHIAAGMSYLSGKKFIHRDLAARNILVSGDQICKIADFGLSRVMDEEYDVYWSSGGMVAVKWAAPEALTSFQYSSASDIWSFAITMFEIWSLGYKPYHEHSNTQTMEKVKEGYRLPPPPGCPRHIYELMIQCWHPNPDQRPEFSAIVTRLNRPDYLLLKLPQDGSKDALSLKAPLRVSHNLYSDLQSLYSSK